LYQALISNVQLGIGYAVPANFIPSHKGDAPVASTAVATAKPSTKTKRKKK